MSKDRIVWIDAAWTPVMVGFCPSQESWRKAVLKYQGKACDYDFRGACGVTRHMENDSGQAMILVALGEALPEEPLEIMMTLVHEAVHVWQFVCRSIGEDSPGIEIEAYSIEHIAQGLIEAYCKTSGKGKVWA